MTAPLPKSTHYVESAEQFRRWLEKNSRKATEVWLGIRKRHSERPGIFYEEAVNEALCFGWKHTLFSLPLCLYNTDKNTDEMTEPHERKNLLRSA